MKKRVVIIGAGLAGSLLAYHLAADFELTVIDLRSDNRPMDPPVTDIGHPTSLNIHVGSGPGGTTQFWNNGLMELESDDFAAWPVSAQDVAPYVARAYDLLSGFSKSEVDRVAAKLKAIHIERGIPPAMLGNTLFYPKQRRNLWRSLGLHRERSLLLVGRASHLITDQSGHVTGVSVTTENGSYVVSGDIFICCAGGLSSPSLIQETCRRDPALSLPAAGRFYSDHPMGMIAEIRLSTKLYDVWNYRDRAISGALQCPLVTRHPSGIKVASFLRPASVVNHGRRTENLRSVLVDLRNAPLKPANIYKFMTNLNDVREVLSFKFGLHLATDTYFVRFVASQPPSRHVAIGSGPRGDGVSRNWTLDSDYRHVLHEAFGQFLEELGGLVVNSAVIPNWDSTLHSAAHHSGSCRMSDDTEDGVCDPNCRIHGLDNAFVCDGSIIPASGYANTGLMIGALALRLANRLQDRAF